MHFVHQGRKYRHSSNAIILLCYSEAHAKTQITNIRTSLKLEQKSVIEDASESGGPWAILTWDRPVGYSTTAPNPLGVPMHVCHENIINVENEVVSFPTTTRAIFNVEPYGKYKNVNSSQVFHINQLYVIN